MERVDIVGGGVSPYRYRVIGTVYEGWRRIGDAWEPVPRQVCLELCVNLEGALDALVTYRHTDGVYNARVVRRTYDEAGVETTSW